MPLEKITDANFDEFRNSRKAVLVYDKKDCRDCVTFSLELNEVLKMPALLHSGIRFGQVDITKVEGKLPENVVSIIERIPGGLESVPRIEGYYNGERVFSYSENPEHPEFLTKTYLINQMGEYLRG